MKPCSRFRVPPARRAAPPRTARPALAALPLAGALLAACAAPPEFDEAAWLARVKAEDPALLYAPHRDERGRFFNPWLPREAERRGARGVPLFRGKRAYPPFPEERYAAIPLDYVRLAADAPDSITFAGHASMIIKMDGETVFTDPFFSGAAALVRKRVDVRFDYDAAPERPVVLISHNHYDHLDTASVKRLIKKRARFIVPLGLGKFFERLGAEGVRELDWWESAREGALTYTLLPAQHWSLRLGQVSGATLWGGWLVSGSRTVYFSGDTGYFCGFAEFGRKFSIDYAIVGAGAYAPRWFMHYQHASPEEAVMAAADLRAKVTIPMHFGVIGLSEEPLLYPLYLLERYVTEHPEAASRFALLRVGETLPMEGP